jgi:hypothetical protein
VRDNFRWKIAAPVKTEQRMGDHGRIASLPQGQTLPERAVRGGAQIAISVTHRAVAHALPTDGSRLQRLAPTLVLMPLLVVVLTLAAILIVVLVLVVALVATALALSAVVRRRLPRAS